MSSDVLIVDDEPVVVKAVEKTLRTEGLIVDSATNADGAGEKIAAQSYRLILCDLMLPGTSGLDVIRRAIELHSLTPVVMITGYATVENTVASFKVGAFDCLPKPFDVEELLGVAMRALRYFDAKESGALPAASTSALALGVHSWARVSGENVTIGMGEGFAPSLHNIALLKLPRLGEEVTQGRQCAEIRTRDGAACRVWSPLSGTVTRRNERVVDDPNKIEVDPATREGWLLEIIANELDDESASLTRIGEERE